MNSVRFGLVLLLLAVISASGDRSRGSNKRPNIVVIVTDDLVREKRVGVKGMRYVDTKRSNIIILYGIN